MEDKDIKKENNKEKEVGLDYQKEYENLLREYQKVTVALKTLLNEYNELHVKYLLSNPENN